MINVISSKNKIKSLFETISVESNVDLFAIIFKYNEILYVDKEIINIVVKFNINEKSNIINLLKFLTKNFNDFYSVRLDNNSILIVTITEKQYISTL